VALELLTVEALNTGGNVRYSSANAQKPIWPVFLPNRLTILLKGACAPELIDRKSNIPMMRLGHKARGKTSFI
jgi:hypothetical protein